MPDVDLGSLLNRIRASVRAQRPYVVGSIPDLRVKLNQNESPYDLPVELKRELQSKLLSIPFNRYPREQPERLRDVLSRHLDVPRESILVGNGSNELTHTLCLCMVEHQTPVVLPRPMFALFESAVRLFGGHPVTVPPTEDLRFDVTGICEAIAAHDPPLTVIATPNNPTGLEMTPEEQQQVVEASQGFVLIDEAYYDFASNPVGLDLLKRFQNVLVMRTFSKSWGLAGLRIGFIVGHPDVISALYRSRLPFMVGELAQETATLLLERPSYVAERTRLIRASLDGLIAEMEKLPHVHVVPSHTNFVIFRTLLAPAVLMAKLEEDGVLIRDMSGYPELQGYARVNAGTEAENKVFLAALKRALA